MFKTVLALTLAAASSLNGLAAVPADVAQAPMADAQRTGTGQAVPRIPTCWIVPISCR
jgi:hypothetical protein